MIKVQFMKPFYTKVSGTKLRLVFAYQYFSIIKDDEVYHFIPIEGKEMNIDLTTMQFQNLSEVFVFQCGKQFMRMPLYQLLLVSDVHNYLKPIIEQHSVEGSETNETLTCSAEVEELILEIEKMHLQHAIDKALKDRDITAFNVLTNQDNHNITS